MRTQSLYKSDFSQAPFTASQSVKRSLPGKENGFISELVYDEYQPAVAQLLVPLLQQLSKQSRWLLWLTPQQKLSKRWLQQAYLPINKVVQLNQINQMSTVEAMEKALLTGNYSVVLGWLPELTEEDRLKLSQAAELGNAYGLIMRPLHNLITPKPCATLKIHAFLYH
jgi:cell division inhibitor SulA